MKHILGASSTSTLSNVRDGDSQPNAVDLRLDKVLMIRPSVFTITEDEKIHRGTAEVHPDPSGYFILAVGSYEVTMENIITVGPAEAGWVITRSTLNRNGVYLTSGLYDTGYSGVMAAVMHVTCGPMRIKRGTRIGQYLSFDSEALSQYAGSYGLGTNDDDKYGLATPVIVAKANTDGTQVVSRPNIPPQVEQPVKRGRGRPKKVSL